MAHMKPTPLPRDGYGSLKWWKDQIEASEDKIQRLAPTWKKNISRQIGQGLDATPSKDEVVVPLDHANVEMKKAQLFFQNPTIQMVAAPGHDEKSDALRAFSAVVNEHLGEDGVDAEAMADEVLSDVLCPSGIGFTVIGLEVTQDGEKEIQVGEEPLEDDSILGLQPQMRPVMDSVPNLIHQRYFWSRISPLNALLPQRWHGSSFDKAPWLGYKFEMDAAQAIKKLGLTEQEAKQAGGDPDRLNDNEKLTSRDTDVVYGYCISYRGAMYNPMVKHPEEIWRLIVVKGVDRIIKHDRPYQQYVEGKLIGMMGHFIHPYTPRYVSDTAIPPSDVSMSRQQVGELQKGRSQMIQQRDRARPMRQMNIDRVDPNQKEKIKNGEYQEIIFTTSSEPIMQEIAHAQYPRENFEFNRIIKADISETWAMGDVQRGLAEETKRTATELSLRASGSDTRLEKERKRFLKWYLRGVVKLGGLIQLFEDERSVVEIAGENNAMQMVEWQKQALPLRFQATASLDTMLRVDTEGQFKKDLDTYQMVANDPHVNRVELLSQLLRKRGYDLERVLVKELPEPTPETPKIGLTVRGEDLNPAAPQFPIIQQVLTSAGVEIAPENVELGLALSRQQMMGEVAGPVSGQAEPDPSHGGPAEQVSPLSKQSLERTGKLDGDGQAQAVN